MPPGSRTGPASCTSCSSPSGSPPRSMVSPRSQRRSARSCRRRRRPRRAPGRCSPITTSGSRSCWCGAPTRRASCPGRTSSTASTTFSWRTPSVRRSRARSTWSPAITTMRPFRGWARTTSSRPPMPRWTGMSRTTTVSSGVSRASIRTSGTAARSPTTRMPRSRCGRISRAGRAIEDSAAVARITIIDGFHQWPGRNGNAPPCGQENCDVDMTEEVLQFWRANAGLRALWP